MNSQVTKSQQEDMLLLNHYSTILSGIILESELSKLILIFLEKMRKIEVKEINPLIINSICNNICAKIFLLTSPILVDQPVFEIIEFMLDQKILPPVYLVPMRQRHLQFKEKENGAVLPVQLTNEGPRKTEELLEQVNQNLNHLLNFNNNEKMNKNYGYSLVGLNGDFIWCDSISQKLFEFKEKKNVNKNIFDLMIPFSRQLIHKKFGEEIFQANCDFGTSNIFSYVTYSKNSMNKFYKCIKSLVTNEEQFRERLKKKGTDDAIYNQYLKALSSRATLVLLKFTRSELTGMLEDRKYGIKSKSQFFQGLLGKNAEKGSKKRDSLKTGKSKKGETAGEDKDKIDDKSELICKEAILLETRLSYNTPRFDYSLLQNDPKIVQFENKIIKRISKWIKYI